MKNFYSSNKRTKIVCTIGPASSDEKTIMELLNAGMDVARMNFSHSTHESHKKTFELLRLCEQKSGRPLGILADLQGPKIRTGKISTGPIELKVGDQIFINNDPNFPGTKEEIGCTYQKIIEDLEIDNKVLIDDGKLVLTVKSKTSERAALEVLVGGTLKDNKGINLPGTPVTASALSEKDMEDLKFALSLGVDYIALSFVRRASDLELAREYMKGTFTGLIAKIERPEAIRNIEEIINASDGIMIARGDMGVELETEQVPLIQKDLIHKMNTIGKPVITATQMLESMIDNPRPTRAEASDVANAVLDGTDAVMLSAESASGKYPVESVKIMNKIIHEAEKIYTTYSIRRKDIRTKEEIERTALGTATVKIAESINAQAIINFTRSGYSARLASEFRPIVPIYSFTPFLMTARKMNLYRGVYSFVMPLMDKFHDMIGYMSQTLKSENLVKETDTVVILAGAPGGDAYTVDFIQVYKIK
ncbi:MAG: pyruvate kinase [Leptospiraceae bacterium]|nr:pyruvate kinase [Leptospiraceae bacterium]MCK6380681.1 pyruvate kinase [Leptospiraceae bacterium]